MIIVSEVMDKNLLNMFVKKYPENFDDGSYVFLFLIYIFVLAIVTRPNEVYKVTNKCN